MLGAHLSLVIDNLLDNSVIAENAESNQTAIRETNVAPSSELFCPHFVEDLFLLDE